jgi:hypothetical protein
MYKKITHNIVEEHFDHPMAGQIKKTIVRSQVPNSEVFDENSFRTNVANYTNSYSSSINKIIESFSSTQANLISEFEQAFTSVDNLGNMTKPFITSELGERMNADFRYILIYTAMAVQSARIGQDTLFAENRILQSTNDLASAMIAYNTYWTPAGADITDNLYAISQSIGNNINKKINAKVSNNAALSAELAAAINSDFSKFGTIFVNGLVRKFPERFTSTPVTSYQECMPTPAPTPAPAPMLAKPQ